MTNRGKFLHSSPLVVAGSTVTSKPVGPEAALFDETGTSGFVQQVRINQQKLSLS